MPPIKGSAGAAAAAAGGAAARAARQAALAAAVGPGDEVAFPPEAIRARCDEIVARYPTRMAAALPVLHVAQAHFGGWISPGVEAGVARYLEVSDQHIRGLLTFYAMYHTEERGRNEVWVCRTLTCWLLGARELTRTAREKAGLLREGAPALKTSEDGRFTVMEMECLGLCEAAPAVFVNGRAHVRVTPEALADLMDACEP